MNKYCRYCSNEGTSDGESLATVTPANGDASEGKRGVGAAKPRPIEGIEATGTRGRPCAAGAGLPDRQGPGLGLRDGVGDPAEEVDDSAPSQGDVGREVSSIEPSHDESWSSARDVDPGGRPSDSAGDLLFRTPLGDFAFGAPEAPNEPS